MLPKVTIVGLGPAGSELLTAETVALLSSGSHVWLRTRRHPAAEALPAAGSFDELYDEFDTFDEVYRAIVDGLVSAAEADGHVIYAVPGSPVVAERTVEMLRVDDRVAVRVCPALSFLDLAWLALGVDPMTEAATIVDAYTLLESGPQHSRPLLITQVHSIHLLEDVMLALAASPPENVVVLKRLGTAEQVVTSLDWDDLDHSIAPDHLTSLWIPRSPSP